jgi:hypothetical protein
MKQKWMAGNMTYAGAIYPLLPEPIVTGRTEDSLKPKAFERSLHRGPSRRDSPESEQPEFALFKNSKWNAGI